MKAPVVVSIVTALHVAGVTALVFIQGCGTIRPTPPPVPEPPEPTMPPREMTQPEEPVTKKPAPIPPPVPVVSLPPTEGAKVTVSKGDTVSAIAQRCGVSSRELAEYNQLSNPDRIQVGQVLVIPPHGSVDRPPPVPEPAPSPLVETVVEADGPPYVVQKGDTLSRIAQRNGTTVSELKSANGLKNSLIVVGQTLSVPGTAVEVVSQPDLSPSKLVPELPGLATPPIEAKKPEPVPPVVPVVGVPDDPELLSGQDKPLVYTVVEGDTVEEIAKLFIVSKKDILSINNLPDGKELKVGQTIKIPPSAL